jgi:hypothetical protein
VAGFVERGFGALIGGHIRFLSLSEDDTQAFIETFNRHTRATGKSAELVELELASLESYADSQSN